MRFFRAFLAFAIFGIALNSVEVLGDGEEEAIKIVECVRKALHGGLKKASIPDHNPLKIRDMNFTHNLVNILRFQLDTTGWLWSGITYFKTTKLEGRYSADRKTISYNYSFLFPQQSLSGKVTIKTTVLGISNEDIFNIRIDIKNWLLSGIFKLVMGENQEITEFTVATTADDIKASVTGTIYGHEKDLSVLGDIAGNILTDLSTKEPSVTITSVVLSPLVKNLLNSHWFKNHPASTETLFNNCNLKLK